MEQLLMTTAATVRSEREAQEQAAAIRAADIAPGDHYASGKDVVNRDTCLVVATCATHWDAVLTMLAANRSKR